MADETLTWLADRHALARQEEAERGREFDEAEVRLAAARQEVRRTREALYAFMWECVEASEGALDGGES